MGFLDSQPVPPAREGWCARFEAVVNGRSWSMCAGHLSTSSHTPRQVSDHATSTQLVRTTLRGAEVETVRVNPDL